MDIEWDALGVVAVVALGVAVLVVALVSFALVGLSARETARLAALGPGGPGGPSGPDDGAAPPRGPVAGTVVAAVCLAAVLGIVGHGLFVIIA